VGCGEADDKVLGRSHRRHRAVFMSAGGQFRGRLRAVSRGRRHFRLQVGVSRSGDQVICRLTRINVPHRVALFSHDSRCFAD
jgi:hypothetical protein